MGQGKLINLRSGWLDRLFGGWRINGIYSYQVGAPIQWMNGSTNNPGDYPLCSVSTSKGLCPSGSDTPSLPTSALSLNNRGVDNTAFDTCEHPWALDAGLPGLAVVGPLVVNRPLQCSSAFLSGDE
jgi:hypothetical protein